MLFVNHNQTQILELNVAREQSVCANQDVYAALSSTFDGVFRVFGAGEPRESFYPHGQVSEAFAKGAEVLVCQQRGGHQNSHLLAVAHHPVRGPHRYLGFAKAHVSGNQSVHRVGLLEVALNFCQRANLVFSQFVLEVFLDERIPLEHWSKSVTGCDLTGGVLHQQLSSQHFGVRSSLFPRFLPGLFVQSAQLGRVVGGSGVTAQGGQQLDGQPNLGLAFVLKTEVIALDSQHLERFNPQKLPHAVFRMNQIIAHLQAQCVRNRLSTQFLAAQRTAALKAVQQILGDDLYFGLEEFKTALTVSTQKTQLPLFYHRAGHMKRLEVLEKAALEIASGAGVAQHHQHTLSVLEPAVNFFGKLTQAGAEKGERP